MKLPEMRERLKYTATAQVSTLEPKEVAEMHALVERLVTLGNEMAATEAASGSVEAARKWRELVRGD